MLHICTLSISLLLIPCVTQRLDNLSCPHYIFVSDDRAAAAMFHSHIHLCAWILGAPHALGRAGHPAKSEGTSGDHPFHPGHHPGGFQFLQGRRHSFTRQHNICSAWATRVQKPQSVQQFSLRAIKSSNIPFISSCPCIEFCLYECDQKKNQQQKSSVKAFVHSLHQDSLHQH